MHKFKHRFKLFYFLGAWKCDFIILNISLKLLNNRTSCDMVDNKQPNYTRRISASGLFSFASTPFPENVFLLFLKTLKWMIFISVMILLTLTFCLCKLILDYKLYWKFLTKFYFILIFFLFFLFYSDLHVAFLDFLLL